MINLHLHCQGITCFIGNIPLHWGFSCISIVDIHCIRTYISSTVGEGHRDILCIASGVADIGCDRDLILCIRGWITEIDLFTLESEIGSEIKIYVLSIVAFIAFLKGYRLYLEFHLLCNDLPSEGDILISVWFQWRYGGCSLHTGSLIELDLYVLCYACTLVAYRYYNRYLATYPSLQFVGVIKTRYVPRWNYQIRFYDGDCDYDRIRFFRRIHGGYHYNLHVVFTLGCISGYRELQRECGGATWIKGIWECLWCIIPFPIDVIHSNLNRAFVLVSVVWHPEREFRGFLVWIKVLIRGSATRIRQYQIHEILNTGGNLCFVEYILCVRGCGFKSYGVGLVCFGLSCTWNGHPHNDVCKGAR